MSESIIKLDLGCGKNKIGPDWIGVDCLSFDGVDVVCDLSAKVKNKFKLWPWEDNSVDEIHASHFVEHLNQEQRVHFVNEIYRILKPGASCKLIAPHWASCRAYGDLTHQWPPVSEFWFYYLSSQWRDVNAPHNVDYKCNFNATWGYSMSQDLMTKNQEYQNFAITNFKEAAQDIIATLIKI